MLAELYEKGDFKLFWVLFGWHSDVGHIHEFVDCHDFEDFHDVKFGKLSGSVSTQPPPARGVGWGMSPESCVPVLDIISLMPVLEDPLRD